jgi:hypothetical protein
MRNIFEEARLFQEFLDNHSLRFCFIGGLALQRWGELRTTNDIDLTLLTGFSNEAEIIDIILNHYSGRLPSAREIALTARVLLIATSSGLGIDIALGGLPFERASVDRASEAEYLPGIFLRTCSAEDLVIHKAFAARPKDWLDIEGILLRQSVLDWRYIEEQLPPLLDLKEEPENWITLSNLRSKLCRQ